MKRQTFLLCAAVAAVMGAAAPATAAQPPPSEISVTVELTDGEYVEGERLKAVVDVANRSPDVIDARTADSPDRLILELSRASDRHFYDKMSKTPFVAPFALLSGEGQRLDTFIADHFPVTECTRYFVRAVLIHARRRYESALKSFSVVPGLKCGGAVQMFANDPDRRREFELVHWGRDKVEHLFLRTRDVGKAARPWPTVDLGAYMGVTRPKVSVLPSGEVIVLHRTTQDAYIRTEFWSLPSAFEFHEHELMLDPDVAGAARVKELYRESGGVEPVKKPWWKFW